MIYQFRQARPDFTRSPGRDVIRKQPMGLLWAALKAGIQNPESANQKSELSAIRQNYNNLSTGYLNLFCETVYPLDSDLSGG